MLGLLLSVSVFISNPAENGVRNIRVEFSEWPRVVHGVRAEDAVLEDHIVDLGASYTFYAAGSFIGLDRGDLGEYDVQIGCVDGPIFYARSLHKEVATAFDAEDWKYTAWPRCQKLAIHFTARVTGPNEILRPGQPWSARPHFGVRLWTWPNQQDGGSPSDGDVPPDDGGDPSDGDPPPADPVKKATDYIPFDERAAWAQRIDDAYSEWRGDRDLGFLLAHGEVVAAFGFNAEQLAADVNRLFAFRQERDALAHRIANCPKHPDFNDRCRVRKDVANDFIRRAQTEAGATYQAYALRAAQCGVKWGAWWLESLFQGGFDSWQGFIVDHENPEFNVNRFSGWLKSHPNGCAL